jgi:hypothetical protein
MELEPPDTGFRLPVMGHGRLFVANRLGSLGGRLPLAAIGCLGGCLWLQPRAAASGCCLWLLPLVADPACQMLQGLGRAQSTGLVFDIAERRCSTPCARERRHLSVVRDVATQRLKPWEGKVSEKFKALPTH